MEMHGIIGAQPDGVFTTAPAACHQHNYLGVMPMTDQDPSTPSPGMYLGTLCRKGHEYEFSGKSIRYASGHCVKCETARKRKKYRSDEAYREKERLRRKEHRLLNLEQSRQYDREYKERNREFIRERSRIRYRDNPHVYILHRKRVAIDKVRIIGRESQRRRRRNNPDAARDYARDYYRRNSLRIRLRNRVCKALKMLSETGKTKNIAEYGIDIEAILLHIGECPGNRSEWHIDHIRPLSSFDFNDPDQIKLAFAPKNHQWLPAKDNLCKSYLYPFKGNEKKSSS